METKDILTLIGFIATIVASTWKVSAKMAEIKDSIQTVKDSIYKAIKENATTEKSNREPIDANILTKISVLEKAVDDCIDKVSVLNGNIFKKDGIYQDLNTLKVLVSEIKKNED